MKAQKGPVTNEFPGLGRLISTTPGNNPVYVTATQPDPGKGRWSAMHALRVGTWTLTDLNAFITGGYQ